MYKLFIKRFLDIVLSISFIIVFWWVYLVVGLCVYYKLGKPVIFKQLRPGYKGKVFTMYKFRTMTDEKDKNGNLLPNDKRLSRFGKLLRATSLDEIPELINVLKGEMSLVGPRPLLVKYLDRYTANQARRHEVKPGITGWAQVNGRNCISWEQKFKYDIEYVDNYSFFMDMKILFLTVKKVLIREGISQTEKVTMEEFKGNKF